MPKIAEATFTHINNEVVKCILKSIFTVKYLCLVKKFVLLKNIIAVLITTVELFNAQSNNCFELIIFGNWIILYLLYYINIFKKNNFKYHLKMSKPNIFSYKNCSRFSTHGHIWPRSSYSFDLQINSITYNWSLDL